MPVMLSLLGRVVFCPAVHRNPDWAPEVLNSAATGRRLMLRLTTIQAVVTLLTAATCLVIEPRAALAALIGGGAMTLGSLVAGLSALSGGVVGAGEALGRLLLGMAMKWLIVITGLYLVMATWQLPAVPALVGVALVAVATLFVSKQGVRTRTNA